MAYFSAANCWQSFDNISGFLTFVKIDERNKFCMTPI